MSKLQQKPVPRIESVGLPPEIHADRVVGEMLKHIAKLHAGDWQKFYDCVRPAGSPKAQKRMIKAIKKAGGDLLIDVIHKPGTRGRYTVVIFDWCVYDPERCVEIMPGDAIPSKPWLACTVNWIEGRREHTSRRILYITHHALSRLAQRCGARTIEDLIRTTKALGGAYLLHGLEARKPGSNLILFPERLTIESICTAVLKKHESGAMMIVTIVEP